jgi:hypothetical protein
MDDALRHNTEVTIVGVTYARLIEMINGWSIVFSPDDQYSVRYVGSNNNLFDIENLILNQNQVQVIANNSAGLITVPVAGGLTTAEAADLRQVRDIIEGDHIEDNVSQRINKKGTTIPVLQKQVKGSLLQPDIVISTTDDP